MQAACGVGLFADMPSAARTMSRINPTPFTPDRRLFDFYTQLYRQVYRHLFPSLQPHLANLTRLNEEYVNKDDT
jgi:ribulose kinase